MTDTPQGPDAGTQEGGYGSPTLEEEVTPEVLQGGGDSGGSGDGTEPDGPTPGELEEDPPAVEPTD